MFLLTYFLDVKHKVAAEMAKSINKVQFDFLLDRMQANPDIACGFVKENRNKVDEFWREVTEKLNGLGIPIKTISEWKKVWSDQKRYVRKKAAQNAQYQKGTGGGPNKTQPFSTNEEAIFQLVGMKEAVEGVDGGIIFEMSSKSSIATTTDGEIIEIIDINFEPSSNTPECSTKKKFTSNQQEIPSPLIKRPRLTENQIATQNMLTKEIDNQKELCAILKQAVDVMKEQNADILAYNKENLREQQRHNMALEDLKE